MASTIALGLLALCSALIGGLLAGALLAWAVSPQITAKALFRAYTAGMYSSYWTKLAAYRRGSGPQSKPSPPGTNAESSPSGTRNPNSHFRFLCQGRPGWESIKISCFDSPNFTGEEVPESLRGLLTSKTWAEDRAAEWGTDNPLYIAKVLGDFPSDHPWAVVRLSDVSACRIGTPRVPQELVPVELGVDVGGGLDETVVRERRGMVAGREWRELSDQPETISRLIMRALKETGATSVKIDSIGVGAGVVGEMKNLKAAGIHDARIYGVNVAEKAHDPVKYFNLRSQLWWECGRLAAQDRAVDFSRMENADNTVAQLLETHYEHDLKGRVKVEPKDEIRKRIGRSPDNADALLLAYYHPRSTATDWFEAAMGGPVEQIDLTGQELLLPGLVA